MGKFDISRFAQTLAVPEVGTRREQIEYIALEKLREDDRNFYSIEGIDELAGNIELIGLQQPLRVRPDGDGYIIVSGHRRCAALRKLAGEGKDRFAKAACIVEQGEESDAMRELRLICANSSTRQLTGAELAKQVERVTELLYQLQEEGVEFPDRMRDHVAEACHISKTKVGRLNYIQEHLSPDLLYLWGKGELNESAAHELAHFHDFFQQRVARLFPGGKGLPTADKIARFLRSCGEDPAYLPALTCPNGKPCLHGDAFLRHDLCAGSWEILCKGETCCLKCASAKPGGYSTCDRMCAQAKARRAEKNAAEKAEAESSKRRNFERQMQELQLTCARMVRAADAAGLSDDVKAQDGSYGDGGHEIGLLRRYARGEFKPDEKPYFYGFDLRHCRTLAKCAQTLRCSTDYLLGLTDELNPAASAPEPPAEGWVPVQFADGRETPPRAGEYWCRLGCGSSKLYTNAQWNAMLGRWEFLNGTKVDAECLGWYPLPPREGTEA